MSRWSFLCVSSYIICLCIRLHSTACVHLCVYVNLRLSVAISNFNQGSKHFKLVVVKIECGRVWTEYLCCIDLHASHIGCICSPSSRVVKLWKESLSKVNQKAANSLADPTAYSNLFPGLQQALVAEQYLKEATARALPAANYPLTTVRQTQGMISWLLAMCLTSDFLYLFFSQTKSGMFYKSLQGLCLQRSQSQRWEMDVHVCIIQNTQVHIHSLQVSKQHVGNKHKAKVDKVKQNPADGLLSNFESLILNVAEKIIWIKSGRGPKVFESFGLEALETSWRDFKAAAKRFPKGEFAEGWQYLFIQSSCSRGGAERGFFTQQERRLWLPPCTSSSTLQGEMQVKEMKLSLHNHASPICRCCDCVL